MIFCQTITTYTLIIDGCIFANHCGVVHSWPRVSLMTSDVMHAQNHSGDRHWHFNLEQLYNGLSVNTRLTSIEKQVSAHCLLHSRPRCRLCLLWHWSSRSLKIIGWMAETYCYICCYRAFLSGNFTRGEHTYYLAIMYQQLCAKSVIW